MARIRPLDPRGELIVLMVLTLRHGNSPLARTKGGQFSGGAAELAVRDRQPLAGVLACVGRCRPALSERIHFEDERRFGWSSS